MSDLADTPVYDWQETDQYDLLAWVKASERRVDILISLDEGPKNSTDFACRWDVTTEAVQYHLKQLRAGGPEGEYSSLVQVVTPEREHYRLWALTEQGQELIKYVK